MRRKLRIGLDVDDTISKFMEPYLQRFGQPKDDFEITHNVFNILRHDKSWWMNVPLVNIPDFTPELFCSKRVHNKNWSKEYIKKNLGFDVPFYQIYYQYKSKAPFVRNKVDVFIDDSPSNFMDLNRKGIPCLLIDSPFNRHITTKYRIYSLHYEEIEYMYSLIFM